MPGKGSVISEGFGAPQVALIWPQTKHFLHQTSHCQDFQMLLFVGCMFAVTSVSIWKAFMRQHKMSFAKHQLMVPNNKNLTATLFPSNLMLPFFQFPGICCLSLLQDIMLACKIENIIINIKLKQDPGLKPRHSLADNNLCLRWIK